MKLGFYYNRKYYTTIPNAIKGIGVGLSNLKNSEKHLDHIRPVCRGGLHVIENLQWLCKDCNVKKGRNYPYKP